MIMGFGNNVVSALAADITASQTIFSVIPGTGKQFAALLTTDSSNPDIPHNIYAKITLTDSQQTVFEICHLIAVSQDTLTVIRAQEGTEAKGWALNNKVANFATRGSEQNFIQIEQLQAGDFTAATAGGTENALAISLPSTFFNNNTTDWQLKTPLIITPGKSNNGPVTLQVALAGRVVGIFPLYKGNKINLEAGDLIAGIAFCCILDKSKSFFNIMNPAAIYNSPVNHIYPVGIVVWFAHHKNPNKIFPGTSWNYIGENRTIRLGKADGSDIMTTGGADSVTLNGNHLPSHQHSFYAQTSEYDYGNKETRGFDHGIKNTAGAGGHDHFLPGATITQDQNNAAVAGGRAGSWSRDKVTNWVGDHHHSVHIGAHSHTVGIGAHAHSVSGITSLSGHNSAFSVTNPFVKLMAWYRNA